ncbi:hypothetical protein QAD02_003813 [Eretmocerus hayati]|uniref:Uncharacterized protein n=1 Tax=Eretmocerus hayati TaxID=131215 RepID=A0ACC2NN83_9HYME|nr:hypothetical protein QAD02_003813 [Eretmocerus hayati]
MVAAEDAGAPVPKPRSKNSAKAVSQVMSALKNSDQAAGPTMTQIVKFISTSLFKPATKRQVITALKRGVEFGILKRHKGHYLILSPEENFTKLPIKRAPKDHALGVSNSSGSSKPAKSSDKVRKRPKQPLKARRTRANSKSSNPPSRPESEYNLVE